MEVRQIGNCMVTGKRRNPNQGRVYDVYGLCPTLTKMDGGGRQPMIIDDLYAQRDVRVYKETAPSLRSERSGLKTVEIVYVTRATAKGYIECEVGGVADLSYPTSTTRRGRVQDMGRVSPTITATETGVHRIESPYRIRRLIPMETWRLMDFSDEDFHKAEAVCSSTQLYKQAGNSIVRNVLVAIFGQMIPGKEGVYKNVVS